VDTNKKLLLSIFSILLIFSASFFLQKPDTHIISKEKFKKRFNKEQRINEAIELERLKTQDPSLGYIPQDRIIKARELTRQLNKQIKLKKSGISNAQWTERGPYKIGGRTRTLMWDPNTANKVWAGGVTGGLWYNNNITNALSEWTSVDDFWDDITIGAIAYDPNNTQIFYVGTGEAWYSGSGRGEGIWKTTDGGTTWNLLGSTTAFHFINDIVVRNEGGQSVLYVASEAYSYKGAWASLNDFGLQRSTDGGLTFTQVLPDHHKPDSQGATHPFSPADIELGADNRIWIGSRSNPWGNGGGSIMWSDDGTTWTIDSTSYGTIAGVGRVELACAPSDANVIYGLIEANNAVERVIYSNNKGTTWTDQAEPNDIDFGISADDFSRGQAWYDLIIQIDPNDPNTAICGGIDLFKTTNAASSWTQISHWFGLLYPEVHSDQHQILFKPGSSSEVIFGNDGGVYYSSNGGTAFTTMNNNYNVTQFYACAIHPTSGTNHFLAGAQDNGTQLFQSAGMNTTTEASGGDGAFTHIDQDEPTYQYTAYVYNNFYRSSDGGSNFSSVDHADDGYFINPSDYDDTNNHMYSSDLVDTYLRWSNAQTSSTFAEVSLTDLGGDRVSAVTVSPQTANRVFFGSNNGKIIRVDNANATPSSTVINTGAGMATAWINCIEIDPTDENHILAIFSNYGIESVWETTDGGTNWTSCEGNLPDMPIRWALIDPNDTGQVLLATELGVWSTDRLNGANTRWEPANGGQANVRTDMLKTRASDNLVLAATHGRGLWSSDVFASVTAGFSVDKTISYANGTVQFTDGSIKATSWSWDFGDGNNSTSQNPGHVYDTPGTYSVTLTINGGVASKTETSLIHIMPSLGTPFTTILGGDFESNADYFDSETTNGFIDVWQLGTPTNALTTLNSGTNGWKTILDADATLGTYTSVLYTPSFNFSTAGTYSLAFRKSMEASGSNAPFGVFVEYSLDIGNSWTRLGASGDGLGTNWYDQSAHTVATGGHAWSGNYSNEATSYDCSSLAGNATVAFRFVFMMEKGYTSGYDQDGFMIDDFEIQGEINDTSLPVELSAFSVAQINAGNGFELQWTTESEIENAFWFVEKKSGTSDFERIAQINGQGTKSSSTEYSFVDYGVDYNIEYTYRLADVSYDGKIEYQDEISVSLTVPNKFELGQNYPNPFNPLTYITYSLIDESPVELSIFDISGRKIKTLVKENQAAGNYKILFDGANLASGIYIYQLRAGREIANHKMTLLK
jgi:PKD repeat protein